MNETITLDPTRLVIAALVGLALLLVLIIKFKIHAMISILIGAIAIGIISGMPFESIVLAVNDSIGNTLKGIALLVGLGSMFGEILEASGGAQTLAVTMVKKFGDKKAAWALGITGLIVAMPVFFDVGLYLYFWFSSTSPYAMIFNAQCAGSFLFLAPLIATVTSLYTVMCFNFSKYYVLSVAVNVVGILIWLFCLLYKGEINISAVMRTNKVYFSLYAALTVLFYLLWVCI